MPAKAAKGGWFRKNRRLILASTMFLRFESGLPFRDRRANPSPNPNHPRNLDAKSQCLRAVHGGCHLRPAAWAGGGGDGGLSLRTVLPVQWDRADALVPLRAPAAQEQAARLPGGGGGQSDGGRHGEDAGGGEIRAHAARAGTQGGDPQPRLQEQEGASAEEAVAPVDARGGGPAEDRERRGAGLARFRDRGRRALHAGPQSARGGRALRQEPGEGGFVCDQALRLRHPDPGRRLPVSAAERTAEPAAGGQNQPLRQPAPAAPRNPPRADQAPRACELRVPDQIGRQPRRGPAGDDPRV